MSTTTSPLDYAARGWYIFPCHSIERGACTCAAGAGCKNPGKHPLTQHGSADATIAVGQIQAWASMWPFANWAVNAGRSGLLVVDVDPRNGGWESLPKWEDDNGALPPTLTALTGGGGRHLFYQNVAGITGKKWLKGVDVKASENDYVILAPARHISGNSYQWVDWSHRIDPVPLSLAESIRLKTATSSTKATGTSVSEALSGVGEGERDDYLFELACRLRNVHGDDREAVESLVGLAAARCVPPFEHSEAMRKVDQAFRQERVEDNPAYAHLQRLVQSWVDAVESTEPKLNLRRASEVRQWEKPEMLIDGVLPPGALFQIFGQTGAYKSFVVLDMLASVANDIPWMGHVIKQDQPGHVAFILGEGSYDAGERLEAWLLAHPEADDERILYSVEEQLDLMDDAHVALIIDELNAAADDLRIVVFDTQADHMPHGDEDKSKDFSVVKRNLQRISHATGAAVGVVHHTGWDDSRERGTSRQRQSLDVVMQVKDQTITNVKQKYGPMFEPAKFTTVKENGSIYVRKMTDDEQFQQAIAEVSSDKHEMDAFRFVGVLLEDPTLTTNKIAEALGVSKTNTLPKVRTWLELKGYVACERNDKMHVTSTTVTQEGVDWYKSKLGG